jgi:hypothetical protein
MVFAHGALSDLDWLLIPSMFRGHPASSTLALLAQVSASARSRESCLVVDDKRACVCVTLHACRRSCHCRDKGKTPSCAQYRQLTALLWRPFMRRILLLYIVTLFGVATAVQATSATSTTTTSSSTTNTSTQQSTGANGNAPPPNGGGPSPGNNPCPPPSPSNPDPGCKPPPLPPGVAPHGAGGPPPAGSSSEKPAASSQ